MFLIHLTHLLLQEMDIDTPAPRPKPPSSRAPPPMGDPTTPKCQCPVPLPAAKLTVTSNGASFGKLYWGCANKGSNQGCQMFLWCDEPSSTLGKRSHSAVSTDLSLTNTLTLKCLCRQQQVIVIIMVVNDAVGVTRTQYREHVGKARMRDASSGHAPTRMRNVNSLNGMILLPQLLEVTHRRVGELQGKEVTSLGLAIRFVNIILLLDVGIGLTR
jgi:hypothetical protein